MCDHFYKRRGFVMLLVWNLFSLSLYKIRGSTHQFRQKSNNDSFCEGLSALNQSGILAMLVQTMAVRNIILNSIFIILTIRAVCLYWRRGQGSNAIFYKLHFIQKMVKLTIFFLQASILQSTEQDQTRVNSRMSWLVLKESWKVFYGCSPHTQFCSLTHKCFFLTNAASFKGILTGFPTA